ncbi:glycosyltransferase family 2 protein [Halalkalibacterium ligniniphilum]|uniref:glycosyltransferase family 2 protein n=1 Tax=Halalkalibacterium ligniniphilum TaxID=1134413 RepID=UPI00034D0998|nr:glycosyltransferase family 2 protein [Halalkalibacterium ligniniphilum]
MTNTEQPLVSIITVCFNSQDTIEDTILSVINQTYENIEYIIIDGGSTDGTIDIIKKYEGRISKYISEPDQGIYDAMNKGINLSKGKLIHILNSDDRYYNDKIVESIIKVYLQNKNVDIFHGQILKKYKRFDSIKKVKHPLAMLKKTMVLYHPSFFVNRKAYERYGKFKSDVFKISADYEWTLRCYCNNAFFYSIDILLVEMNDGGISSNNMLNIIKEDYIARKLNEINYFYNMAFSIRRLLYLILEKLRNVVVNGKR